MKRKLTCSQMVTVGIFANKRACKRNIMRRKRAKRGRRY